jgi:hypothetical protein
MPADPFREEQYDWTAFAAGDAAFFSAHIAAGMAEIPALELTKEYMRFWLGVMLASAPQQPEQGESPQQDPGGV